MFLMNLVYRKQVRNPIPKGLQKELVIASVLKYSQRPAPTPPTKADSIIGLVKPDDFSVYRVN